MNSAWPLRTCTAPRSHYVPNQLLLNGHSVSSRLFLYRKSQTPTNLVIILDAPSLTGTPICTDHTENSITLGWAKPRNDGGTPITGFVIEKREKGTDKWVP